MTTVDGKGRPSARILIALWEVIDGRPVGWLAGRGTGRLLVEWAVAKARERGCRMVQLTTDRRRPGALRFYEALGFEATHRGLKLML